MTMALAISGCASLSPDGGMRTVQSIASMELGKDVARIKSESDAVLAEARARDLLAGELLVDEAVQVALLSNKGLQADFAELAATEAQSVEESLPPSPTFSLSRIVGPISGSAVGNALEIERQILANVLGLLTLPRRRELAEGRFHQAQLKAAEGVLRVAAETRRAYYRAVAAARIVAFLEEAKLAAEAASEAAKRLGETGAINKLQQAREHAFYAELSAQLAAAKLRMLKERERLTRLMGLWGSDIKFRLPALLPNLPKQVKALRDVESEAIQKRIDLEIARMELDLLAKSLGLTRRTRFVNVLDVAGIQNLEREKAAADGEFEKTKTRRDGFELEFQIPLFDFGEARERRAEELYIQAVHRLAELAINIRSQVREAYQGYRGTYDIAMHYHKEILPLRKLISDETLLRYSAMVSDLSELLVDARARVASNIAAIEALRDFLLAKTDLESAIIGGGAGGDRDQSGRVAVAAETAAGGH